MIRRFAWPWSCALPLLAAACGGESPTGGTEDELDLIEGSLLSVAGNGQVGTLSHPLSDSLIVKVADPSGNGLPGVTVGWSVSSDGMVSSLPRVTDSVGQVKVQWTLGRVAGEQTATEQTATASASVSGVDSVVFTATTPSLVPLTDMGASTYFGFPGGLYSGGNVMPQAHADAGLAAAAAVEPLDVNGDPSPAGKYVLINIGASVTNQMFCIRRIADDPCPSHTFTGKAIADADVDWTNLEIYGGGFGGRTAEEWQSPSSLLYDRIRDERLGPRGLSELQVQVVWLHTLEGAGTPLRPDADAQGDRLVRQVGNIVRTLRSRYPNLRLVFLGSRMYGGYVLPDGRHEEPLAYETGLKMKWLIQAQIDQMANGGTIVDVGAGDLNYNTVAPWIGWGPYFWADGVNPRSDGHFWSRVDYAGDYIHQSDRGKEKAASLLLAFFKTSPQARCWFLAGETC